MLGNEDKVEDINDSIAVKISRCGLWHLLSEFLCDEEEIEDIYHTITIEIGIGHNENRAVMCYGFAGMSGILKQCIRCPITVDVG